eukprot:7106777-Pyramimonas_sp.AAC.2
MSKDRCLMLQIAGVSRTGAVLAACGPGKINRLERKLEQITVTAVHGSARARKTSDVLQSSSCWRPQRGLPVG